MTDLEKILAKVMSNKKFEFIEYKELSNSKIKKKQRKEKNEENIWKNISFTKEDIWVASKNLKDVPYHF